MHDFMEICAHPADFSVGSMFFLRWGEVDNVFVCLLLIKDARYTNLCKSEISSYGDLPACISGLMDFFFFFERRALILCIGICK